MIAHEVGNRNFIIIWKNYSLQNFYLNGGGGRDFKEPTKTIFFYCYKFGV